MQGSLTSSRSVTKIHFLCFARSFHDIARKEEKMKRAVFLIVELALCCALMSVVGCRDAEKEAELQSQINAAKSDLVQVQAANEAVMRVGDSLNTQLKLAQAANDSLMQANKKTTNRLASAQADLKKERKQVDSLKLVITEMEPAVRELPDVQRRLADEQAARQSVEARNVLLVAELAEQKSFVSDRITPWYQKWEHDATERNWLEKLFGADKAPTPGVPKPDLK